jgi:hypothetical protein
VISPVNSLDLIGVAIACAAVAMQLMRRKLAVAAP